jgi:hypothetical protein
MAAQEKPPQVQETPQVVVALLPMALVEEFLLRRHDEVLFPLCL